MANGEETIVVVPVIVEVVQVEVPLRTVPVQVTDMPIAVELHNRTLCKIASVALSLEYSRGVLKVFVILCITHYFAPTISVFIPNHKILFGKP